MALAGLLLSGCLGAADLRRAPPERRGELGWRMAILGSQGDILLLKLIDTVVELHIIIVQNFVPRLQICICLMVSAIGIGQSSDLLIVLDEPVELLLDQLMKLLVLNNMVGVWMVAYDEPGRRPAELISALLAHTDNLDAVAVLKCVP
jgi:hypothetical protein